MKCLILSQGPVPTPEHIKVEGGGLRCWGIARGLSSNNPDLEITVAYHDSYKKETFTNKQDGIQITTWNIETVSTLMQKYDSIIVSYCMGDLSMRVADTIRSDQQLILDCYVPIYVEVSARRSNDIEGEYVAFHHDAGRWGHVLRRGDLFLCASDAQLKYYKGVLSALGRINPITYGDQLILIVPYGIYRDKPRPTSQPITKLIGNTEVKKILWFGGIYPWFDLNNLIDAVKLVNESTPVKLIIVGAKNPFNNHPDFVRPYEDLVKYIDKSGLKNEIILQDWVKFEERGDWYLDSDLVVVVNEQGDENELAWRTRLVDFMWGDLPIITNGGDPLSELMIENQAAARFHGLTAETMSEDIVKVLKDNEQLKKMRSNLAQLKSQFYWDVVTKGLSSAIVARKRAKDISEVGPLDNRRDPSAPECNHFYHKLKKAYTKLRLLPAYINRYGMRNTYFAIRAVFMNQLKRRRINTSFGPRVLFFSHQLDMSGAPFVFMDLAEEMIEQNPDISMEFHTFNPTHPDNIKRLGKIGIKPYIHLIRDIVPSFTKGDVVVLNTVAHSRVLKDSIYDSLKANVVRRLVWFVHEDDPALIFDSYEKKRITKLLDQDKIIFFGAADQIVQNYRKFFKHDKNIRFQPYRYVIPERFHKVRVAKDFDKLNFILPGTVGDGRKGQLPVMYALKAFIDRYYNQNPSIYRDFKLIYVGLDKDFLSKQIMNHGSQMLGRKFKQYGRVTHEHSSELIMQANMTICYSLGEALPLFVFEGMAAGHPILRNDSSGMKEQLFNNKNGYYLESKNFDQVVETFERVLNKAKTSNRALASMSAYSNKVARAQEKHSYRAMIDTITSGLVK